MYIACKNIATPLQKGDQFISVAISSIINNKSAIIEGIKILEDWGLVCHSKKLEKHQWGYLAGNDDKRFNELYPDQYFPLKAFARGGWGAARLLERNHPWEPGWFLGYSDVSAILLARLSAGFGGGIHGPMLNSLANEPEWSQQRLRSILFGNPIPDLLGEPWAKGIASGPLVACNLTVGSHLLGSRHIPNLKGAILILEDVGEAPYRIDRMLTHWRLSGKFHELAGLGFGDFKNCDATNQDENNHREVKLEQILKERSLDLNIPIVGRLPIGHCCGNAALPLGAKAILNGNKGLLSLMPS